MTELTIEISEDLKQKMSELPDIDWERVIAEFIREKVFEWAKLRSIVNKSEFSDKDALEIGRKVNESLAKKYKESISDK